MLQLILYIRQWLRSQDGQDLVEYALLLGLIALICIAAVTLGGQAISTIWTAIAGALQGAVTSAGAGT